MVLESTETTSSTRALHSWSCSLRERGSGGMEKIVEPRDSATLRILERMTVPWAKMMKTALSTVEFDWASYKGSSMSVACIYY